MALSRAAKTWLIVLSIPILLLICGVVALKLFFTGERLKAFLVPKIEEATGRTVTVGDVSLSVLPSIAVEVESLAISNKQGKGFSDRPFLTLDRLVLDVNLIPLIKGALEIPTVLVDRPTLLLEINEEGLTNYSSEEEKQEVEHDSVKVAVELGTEELLLSNLQIVDGKVEYYDRQENSAMTMEGINQVTRIETEPVMQEARINSESSVDRFSYGSLTSTLISDLRLTVKQELVYKKAEDRMTIVNGEGSVQDIVLTMTGQIDSVSTAPTMNIVLESKDAGIPALLSLAPKEYMKKAEGLEGTGTAQVKITISGLISDSTKPDIRGSISANNATIRYASLPKPITDICIVSDFTRTAAKQEFRVTKFSANLGENPLNATMTVIDFEHPSMTLALDAAMNLAEINDYYPVEAGTELSGRLNADVNIAGKVDDPRSMKASGSMNFQNVTIKTASSPNPIRNLNGSITFNNQVVEAKKLSMNLGKSDLTLAFWVRNYLSLVTEAEGASPATANLTLNSNHLYTADITADDKAPASTGKSGDAPKEKGALILPDIAMDVSATIGTLTMEKFEMTGVRGTMKISDGVITMQNFSGNMFEGSLSSKGTVDLRNPDQPVFDLALDMTNINGHALLPNFTSFGNRLFGNLSMSTTLKGSLDDTLGFVPQSLLGQGNVQVKSGKLTGVKVNQSIASLVGVSNLESINFNDWANTFTISNGRMEVKNLNIKALDADYSLNGFIGLDGSLDCAMTVLLPASTSAKLSLPGFAGQAVDLFKEPSGRVKLDFTVGGMFDSPKVSLRTESATKKAEQLAKQKLASEAKKKEDELKKKAEDLLKGLDPFKKKK